MNQKQLTRLGAVGLTLTIFIFGAAPAAHAQATTGYGVTAAGELFRFDIANPNLSAVVIGTLPGGVVTEGIDFRPGTQTLYGIDVGPNTSQVYIIDTTTAALTPVGAGFPSSGNDPTNGPYNLTDVSIGFDFNPRTLQGDGSVRIRVVTARNDNLRLNSDTGAIAVVDVDLSTNNGSAGVDAAAYINSRASTLPAAGTTTLYDIGALSDSLYIQNPPNNGNLNFVGSLGALLNVDSGVGFDIFSNTTTDDTIADDFAYAVLEQIIDDVGTGPYLLYNVNLATGQITGGASVGLNILPTAGLDFVGGFAVIPEPSSLTLLGIAAAGFVGIRRRRRK